ATASGRDYGAPHAAGTLDTCRYGPVEGGRAPRAIESTSETTATPVGSPPAPRPPKLVSPPERPVTVTRFSLPLTRASGEVNGTSAGPTAAVRDPGVPFTLPRAICRTVH